VYVVCDEPFVHVPPFKHAVGFDAQYPDPAIVVGVWVVDAAVVGVEVVTGVVVGPVTCAWPVV